MQLMHVENPLRMLRSGHLPMVKTRSRTATIPSTRSVDRRSAGDGAEMSKSGLLTKKNLNILYYSINH